jgi:hypothetical protein
MHKSSCVLKLIRKQQMKALVKGMENPWVSNESKGGAAQRKKIL